MCDARCRGSDTPRKCSTWNTDRPACPQVRSTWNIMAPNALPLFHVEHCCGKMGLLFLQLVYAAIKCLCWFVALKSVIANAQRVGLFCKRLSDSLKN